MPTPNGATHCRRLRTKAGLSMIELAVKAGVSPGTIQRLEYASSPDEVEHITIGSVIKVSDALGVRPWQLYAELG